MLILFIDDQMIRHNTVDRYLGGANGHTILHTFDYTDTINTIANHPQKIDLAMFDRDLGDFACPNCDNKLSYEFREGVFGFPRDGNCYRCTWKYGDEGALIERTGETIIQCMLEDIPVEKWPNQAIVHSHNDRAKYMVHDLQKAGIPTRQERFTTEMIQTLALELAK